MFSTAIILKLVLVLSFNSLEASDDNITSIMNDMGHSVDDIKNKYFLIRHNIFSPENSVSTNYGTYSDSLAVISSKLIEVRYEIFEKILELDIINLDHLDKISEIKIKSKILSNSINLLSTINNHYTNSYKRQLASFGNYKAQIQRLITFEKLLYEME